MHVCPLGTYRGIYIYISVRIRSTRFNGKKKRLGSLHGLTKFFNHGVVQFSGISHMIWIGILVWRGNFQICDIFVLPRNNAERYIGNELLNVLYSSDIAERQLTVYMYKCISN